MADRRIRIDVFQVGLYHSAESTVYNGDGGQYQEEVSPDCSSGRHQEHGDAETSVTAQFHQYACMKHGYSCRC